MDRQPKLITGQTDRAVQTAIGGGWRYFERVCEVCNTRFTVPRDATEKCTSPQMQNGREVPVEWFCSTRQTRINGLSDYRTPRRMTQMDAATYFDKELGNLAQVSSMYRKVPVRHDLQLCRKCYKRSKTDELNRHLNTAIVVRPKSGQERKHYPHKAEPVPVKLREGVSKPRVKDVAKDEMRIWWLSTPSTRHETSQTLRTDKPCTLKEAKEFFRRATGRLTLAGCSITG